jgi:methionine-rich copper-binding protein CopC
MKFARIACALVLIGCSAFTFAHARLVKADPADGSTVTVAPTKFMLTFGEPAKLTVLSLQKDAEPAKKIGPLPTNASAEISVPAPKLAPGKYVLSWRAVGDDGHVMPGKLSFTVGPSPAATSAPGSTSL